MIITILPEDIIKRGLWVEYKKFVLKDKNEDEIKEIVEKNEPSVISEEDAYVVGLLKVIETDNLIHVFNNHIIETLQIKSNIFDNSLYINKNIISREIISYKTRYPAYYKPNVIYQKSIDVLFSYIDKIKENLDKLESFEYESKEKKYEFYDSNKVKRILDL
jgi:hypothetical protein